MTNYNEREYENRRDALFDLKGVVSDLDGAITAYLHRYDELASLISVANVLDDKEINPISLNVAVNCFKAKELYQECLDLSEWLDKLPRDDEVIVEENETVMRYFVLKVDLEMANFHVKGLEKDFANDRRPKTANVRLPTSYKEHELQEELQKMVGPNEKKKEVVPA